MGIYKEAYRLSENFPGFNALKEKLDNSTGLNNELEIVDEKSAVIINKKLKISIEASIELDNLISLYFAPRRKKYLEWSLIFALNDYLVIPNEKIPSHAKKKWQELTFLEKYFK